MLLVRDRLVDHITIFEEEELKTSIDDSVLGRYKFTNFPLCKRALYFTLDENIIGKKVLFGAVYIEGENSAYFDRNSYLYLEESLLHLNFDQFCLMGDFNSRTGALSDILDREPHNDAQVDVLDFEHGARISADSTTNTMGYELISFLKTSQMAIANGRLGQDRGIGKLTCKNASVVDYVILSYDLLGSIK